MFKKNQIFVGIVSSVLFLASTSANADQAEAESSMQNGIESAEGTGFRLGDWINVEAGLRAESVKIDPIENAEINNAIVNQANLSLIFKDPASDKSFEYNRSQTLKQTDGVSGVRTESKEVDALNQLLSLTYKKLVLSYDDRRYSTYLTNTSASSPAIRLFRSTNTTAKTGTVYSQDEGVEYLGSGESATLQTRMKRFELGGKSEIKDNSFNYYGFHETTIKPWSDPYSGWTSNNQNITVVYADTKVTTIGLGARKIVRDLEIEDGFSMPRLGFEIGWSDVAMTNNYSYDELLDDNTSITRYGVEAEVAYKKSLSAYKSTSHVLFAVGAKYNKNSISVDECQNCESRPLTGDMRYWIRAAIGFK